MDLSMKGFSIMNKLLKTFVFIVILSGLTLSTTRIQAGAPLYILYQNLRGVFCAKGTYASDPSYGPYYAYIDMDINSNYPPGAVMHSVVAVNGVVTHDTWTTLATGFSGVTVMERIDSPTPNYTGTKMIELWYGGILRSKTQVKVWCNDSLTGSPAGPYGYIVAADIF
jgi:hypothetical protein